MHLKLMFLSFIFFLVVLISSFDAIDPVVAKSRAIAEKSTYQVKPSTSPRAEVRSEFKTHIFFMKGQLLIPSRAKQNIKEIFVNAKKSGKKYSAKIISWGDQLRPHNKKKSLTSSQLKLVEDRNDRLEAYLERLDLHMRVMKISMAERPDVMDGLLSKDDLKLKKNLEFTDEPFASKSIVMFVLSNQSSHRN